MGPTHHGLRRGQAGARDLLSQRLFTLEEAEGLLPTVRPLVEKLQALSDALGIETGGVASGITTGNGSPERASRLVRDQEAYRDALKELTELGIVVRDPSSGLIDFPSKREGKVVFLCWRVGEERIAYWHDPESGFAGRKPL